jgi:transketolase
MRLIFGKTLTSIAIADPKVILLLGDIGWGIFDNFPEAQKYNVGVIEQSMVGIAAGMAIAGMKPWVYTITPFLLERAFEQIKIDVDANNVNVKLVGYCYYPGQGITHSNMLFRDGFNPFKNTLCHYPRSSEETGNLIKAEYLRDGPAVISLTKEGTCK